MNYLIWILIVLMAAAGCGDGRTTEQTGRLDAGYSDGGDDGPDAQTTDARTTDARTTDVRSSDSRDEGEADADSEDASKPDADSADAAPADADEGDEDTRSEEDADDSVEPRGPFVVWMAPDGRDSRDGSSPAQAVLSLTRVHEILVAGAPQTDVEVRIAPGLYRGQQVDWTFSVPGHTVTLTRLAGESGRPVFDGCLSASNCPGGTWFMMRRSDGAETGIVFNYIKVQNYQTAISLNGKRDAEAHSNGSNKIYGCYFKSIGNVFNPALSPSTAAVRLVNSDDNVIVNNHFVDIINTVHPGRLHAIYLAHMSDRNQILRNRFYNNAGGPIRVRDYSNDNTINDNEFEKVAVEAAYSEWYCDHDARTDCTKATAECPSWGNQFRDNRLNGTYACDYLRTFIYYQDDATTGCSPPSASARRLRTSGNTHAATPCG
jgi:hypothetical protein